MSTNDVPRAKGVVDHNSQLNSNTEAVASPNQGLHAAEHKEEGLLTTLIESFPA
jgi:hypothetical protein